MKIRTGCSGWSYSTWSGTFYPGSAKPGDYLSLYSRVFDTVEIDSTFYAIPDGKRVMKWKESTPDDFLFVAKAPRTVTHERRLRNAGAQMGMFLKSMENLGDKLGMVLLQFPASFTAADGERDLEAFLGSISGDVPIAVEFRDNSWFSEGVLEMLSDHHATLAWSDVPMASPPHVLTTGNAYIRLVGDRSIKEEDFGKVARDRKPEISEWAGRLREYMNVDGSAFVMANNHYQGFSPATVNEFRRAAGLDVKKWDASVMNPDEGQSTLFDW